jgi:hypothetical protein
MRPALSQQCADTSGETRSLELKVQPLRYHCDDVASSRSVGRNLRSFSRSNGGSCLLFWGYFAHL